MTLAERRAHAEQYLLVFGDNRLFDLVIDTVAGLPDAAFQFAIEHTVWVLVGLDSDGWTSSARLVDREGRSRERMIVIGPNGTPGIVLHELAHALCGSLSPAVAAMSVAGERGFHRYLEAQGRDAWATEAIAAEERRANVQADAWTPQS